MSDEITLTPAADTPATVADVSHETNSADASHDKNLGDIFDKLTGNDKARDNTGRFKANESAASVADGSDPDQAGAEVAGETPDSERQVQPVALPPNWPKDKAEAFSAIPEAARGPVQEVLQGLHAKMSDQGRALSQFRDIEPIIADMKATYGQFFQENSQTPASAIATLYSIQKGMDADPMSTWWSVAEKYNLIPQLAQRFTQAGQPPGAIPQAPTPDPAAMLRQVEQRFASMLSPERLEQQISSVMSKTQTQESISRFSQEKPLWSEVEGTLPTFIEIARDQQPDATPMALLEAAYDMAVHANPATRAKILNVALPATIQNSDASRAAKAKAANQINVKTTSNGKAKARTDDEVYGEAWDRVTSAA